MIEYDMPVCGELIHAHAGKRLGDEGMVRGLGHRDAADLDCACELDLDGLEGIFTRLGEDHGRDQPSVAKQIGSGDAHASVYFKVHQREAAIGNGI
ncbi:hypothetical protein [Paracoccus pantotrophus]|uniref:hypothetical protein n=1 Tax=Paracoccus pantotrophus TaxID=82367 RepID=UPI0012DD8AF0|nr:hypothetical protein [Paracoccus pantotrophus]